MHAGAGERTIAMSEGTDVEQLQKRPSRFTLAFGLRGRVPPTALSYLRLTEIMTRTPI